MSQRHHMEIRMAAARAAIEAAGRERARCLWILDELLKRAQQGLDQKLLTPVEMQVAKVRAEITKTIVIAAKTLILSGAKPPQPPASRQRSKVEQEPKNRVREAMDQAMDQAAGELKSGKSLQDVIQGLKKAMKAPDEVAQLILGDQNFVAVAAQLRHNMSFAVNMALEASAQARLPRMVATSVIATELSIALVSMMAATIHSVAMQCSAKYDEAAAMGLRDIPAMFLAQIDQRLSESLKELQAAQADHDKNCKEKHAPDA